MCDKSNAEEIVAEMLAYLKTADYAIREEMVRNNYAFVIQDQPVSAVESENLK